MTKDAELGTMLRTWRDRVQPGELGLSKRHGGRTPGLRREDLAAVAGLSVDYVVRLEQGRAAHPSAPVIAALARALQLDDSERHYLYRLAGLLPPGRGQISHHIPAGVQRLVARLGDVPIGVFAADWTLLTWNDRWTALFGNPGELPIERRNLARATFLDSDHEHGGGFVAWPVPSASGGNAEAIETVADLRDAAAKYTEDSGLRSLIEELRTASPRFETMWQAGSVGERVGHHKVVQHPEVGDIAVDCDVLHVPRSDLRIVAFTAAAGSIDAERLDFLGVAASRLHFRS